MAVANTLAYYDTRGRKKFEGAEAGLLNTYVKLKQHNKV